MTRRVGFLLLGALALAACDGIDFAVPSIVLGPRVLAIVADRPEVAPGEDVRVHAIVAGAEGRSVELRWSMCPGDGGTEQGGFGSYSGSEEQYGVEPRLPGCDPASPFTTPLTVDLGEAVVPGGCPDPSRPWECTSGMVDLFESLSEGAGVPSEYAAQIIDLVGVTVTVAVDVHVDGEFRLTAFKRINVTRRAALTTNPPPPRFAIGGVWLSARAGTDPHVCVSETGETPIVPAVSEVSLRPDADESWIETFPVVGFDGDVVEGTESAYYSWFSTDGEFDPEVSAAPARDGTWLSPEALGIYPIWVVVRDGHLGQIACRADVEVTDVVPPFGDIERF